MMTLLDWPMLVVAAIWALLLVIEGAQWSLRRRLRQDCAREGHAWAPNSDPESWRIVECARCGKVVQW